MSQKIDGMNGFIEVNEKSLTINRKGSFGRKKPQLTIKFDAIKTIQFKPAGWLPGYIEFITNETTNSITHATFAVDRENCLTFNEKQQPAFESLKQQIENL